MKKNRSIKNKQSSLAGGVTAVTTEVVEQGDRDERQKKYSYITVVLVGIMIVSFAVLLIRWIWSEDYEQSELPVDTDGIVSGIEKVSERSDWMEGELLDTSRYEMEIKTQYSSRSVNTKTEIIGWSKWSKWSTDKQVASDDKEVETKSFYEYKVYRIICSCGNMGPVSDIRINFIGHLYKYHSLEVADAAYPIVKDPSSSPYDNAMRCQELSGVEVYYETKTLKSNEELFYDREFEYVGAFEYDGERWFSSSAGAGKKVTQYRYRTAEYGEFIEYGEWSQYSDVVIDASDSVEVKTRIVFEFREKESVLLQVENKDQ